MADKFDVIVIGSGPGGSQVAEQLVKEKKKVAMVDYLFGGTCALWGCTPKKAMESVTSQWIAAREVAKAGFPALHQSVNWSELVRHQKRFTELIPANTKEKWREKGATIIEGTARFINKDTIKVGDESYTAD